MSMVEPEPFGWTEQDVLTFVQYLAPCYPGTKFDADNVAAWVRELTGLVAQQTPFVTRRVEPEAIASRLVQRCRFFPSIADVIAEVST